MEETLEELLQLNSDDPIPRVSEGTLQTMHDSLASELSVPFDAIYSEPTGEESDDEFHITVHRLLAVDDHPVFGPYLGILCEATSMNEDDEIVIPISRIIEVKEDQNRAVINAYNTWFWECR